MSIREEVEFKKIKKDYSNAVKDIQKIEYEVYRVSSRKSQTLEQKVARVS